MAIDFGIWQCSLTTYAEYGSGLTWVFISNFITANISIVPSTPEQHINSEFGLKFMLWKYKEIKYLIINEPYYYIFILSNLKKYKQEIIYQYIVAISARLTSATLILRQVSQILIYISSEAALAISVPSLLIAKPEISPM